MILKKKQLAMLMGQAFAGVAIAVSAGVVQAQQASDAERITITGSSIKRIAAEGALPVTVLKAEDIASSGATSAVDLVKKLSTAQGGTNESSAVGGGSYGFSGISIHNIGETRTLVLLNGRRLAQFGGQTLTGFAAGFDLNSIPLSAIERVELLTDGASALYGADAIGGVVNFITKRNITEGDVTLGFSNPKGGAQEKRWSAMKGFGTLQDDGYNVMLAFAHDERTQLKATDRSFAATGKKYFTYNGKQYRKQDFSPSPIPANALDDQGQLISPYLKTKGSCPEKTFRVTEPYNDGSGLVDDYCGFDFVGELEIYPERKRDNFMASATTTVGGHEVFADILFSRTNQISRIAPVPGGISIPAGTPLHDKYLVPVGITGNSTAFYRLFDLGKRTSDDTAEFTNIVLGSKGLALGWDYNTSFSYSVSDVKGSISGYPGALAIGKLRRSGLLDPFVGPGQQSAAAQAAIDGTSYKGYWDGGVSKLSSLSLNGSRELTQMAGGPLMLGAGFSANKESFESKPSLFAQGKLSDPVAGTLCDGTAANPCDQRFGDEAATPPYSASRKSQGIYGELVMPVTKALELGAALRLDHYEDFGDATTAKASFRWTAAPNLLFRGSVGTGFHAPTVPQVNGVEQPYGVTTNNFVCSPELAAMAASKGASCQPGNKQYDQFAGGNSALQPEKSKQATLGLRYEPTGSLSLGADLWYVEITNAFGQLTEELVFANPSRFPSSWTTKTDTGTGVNYLAFLASNGNLGDSSASGLDLDFSARMKTDLGQLTSRLTVSHMLREVSQLEKNGPFYSAIGNYAELGGVTFRTQGRLATSLKAGPWTHTLGINFQSGYKDEETTLEVIGADGNVSGYENVRIDVGYYTTLDWQTVWTPSKQWVVSAGVLNLLDKDPPFVISAGGGQQVGYDDRYYDPRGRTIYLNVSYKF